MGSACCEYSPELPIILQCRLTHTFPRPRNLSTLQWCHLFRHLQSHFCYSRLYCRPDPDAAKIQMVGHAVHLAQYCGYGYHVCRPCQPAMPSCLMNLQYDGCSILPTELQGRLGSEPGAGRPSRNHYWSTNKRNPVHSHCRFDAGHLLLWWCHVVSIEDSPRKGPRLNLNTRYCEFMSEMRHPWDFWKAFICAQTLIVLLYVFYGTHQSLQHRLQILTVCRAIRLLLSRPICRPCVKSGHIRPGASNRYQRYECCFSSDSCMLVPDPCNRKIQALITLQIRKCWHQGSLHEHWRGNAGSAKLTHHYTRQTNLRWAGSCVLGPCVRMIRSLLCSPC
jgi:hypothetical protein